VHFARLPAGDHPALIHFSLEFRERVSLTGYAAGRSPGTGHLIGFAE